VRGSFGRRLLRWYDRHRRDLPWRRTRDPWAIWVSEVMLQQTRVEAVRDAYVRFLRLYPRASALAAATDDELLAAWRGLGYYRRARLLREAARTVAGRHRGRVPADPDLLSELPGIGAYTRGAIASIAFGLPLPAIDGNVERVAARHLALQLEASTAAGRTAIEQAVRSWLDPRRPGDFNQALMELGATICAPASPACARCPVATDCAGRRAGIAAALPVKRARPRPIAVDARVLVVPSGPGVLGFRVPAGEPNTGQWELPGPGVLRSVDPADLAAATAERCGARWQVGAEIGTVRHSITNHRIVLVAHAGSVRGRAPRLRALSTDASAVPWTTASRKVFARLRADVDA
jgi:A/G-specific adenine glycosylase